MQTSLSRFDPSALPPARSFYEKELGELRRPSRGWAKPKAGCPFHQSKSRTSFAVNMNHGGFRCLAPECDQHGDMVTFVMLRENLDFKRAAQSLGAWRGEITQAESKALNFRQQERDCQRADEADRKESERRERIEARDHLHAVQTLYEEAIAEHDWLSMSELLPRVRQAEEQYWQLAGLEVRHEC